jgi:citrate synthase
LTILIHVCEHSGATGCFSIAKERSLFAEDQEHDLYLSAEDAAAMLGVTVATLYAYVGRKGVRSVKAPGVRNRRYWRVDIERIRSGRSAQAIPAANDTLVRETKITLLTEAGPFYRGHSAIELARTSSLEDVAALLWQVDRDDVFGPSLSKSPKVIDALNAELGPINAVEKAIALFPFIERENPRAYDLSPVNFARTGADILRWFTAFIVDEPGPRADPIAPYLTERLKLPEGYENIIRTVMILSADHELDPTTYVVRAAANAGITPYKIASIGLEASTGRRLSFGRSESLFRLLDEILHHDPRAAIIRRVREGEALPGFGSSTYQSKDPRAAALLSVLRQELADDPQFQRFEIASEAASDATGLHPDFALTSVFAGMKLGMVEQAGTLFRLGRLVGWIAHAIEQYHDRPLIRLRAAYTGDLPANLTR